MLAPMSFRQIGWRWTGVCLLLLGTGGAPAAPSISVGTTAGAPGTSNLVPVNVTIDANVTLFQFDLLYATNDLTPGTPVGGSALADQQLGSAVVSPGLIRVLGYSFSNSPITNGVLAYVPFAIATNAPDHDEMLMISNVLMVSAQLIVVPATVNSNAVLSVTVPPRFSAIFPTNAGAMHLELTGTTGRVYVIQAATNLALPQWSPLATNTDITGTLPFDDVSAAAAPSRFYRAVFDH